MNDINELKCYGDYISFENGADEQSLRSAILILKQLFNSRVKPIFGEEIIFGNSDENEIKIYPLKDGEIEEYYDTSDEGVEIKWEELTDEAKKALQEDEYIPVACYE